MTLAPLSIGPVTVTTPVFLAPMTGVSDLPFRRLVKHFGAGLVFSEMIASRPMLEDARCNKLRPADYADEFPMAVQLAGCEPDMMAEAAKLNEQRGAAIIDINFGCPVKKVVKNFAGSALMRDEPLAARILEATVKAVSVPVTLKMRLGWDENSINAPRLARIAEDLGIRLITIHGRTRNQLYNGHADWHAVHAVRDATRLPLIVNGDITDAGTAREALARSGADGVMVGRGSYGRPWRLRQIMDALTDATPAGEPDNKTRLPIILRHYDDMLAHYGTHVGMPLARKHLGWYCDALDHGDEVKSAINQMNDPRNVIAALERAFA